MFNMRVVNLVSLSIGCSSWPGWGFEAPVHWRPSLWWGFFNARRNILCVVAVSSAMEIIMHGSILYKGHCACVTCFMHCFTLSHNWGAHHVVLRGKKKKKSLISTRIMMAERQGQFCYSFVSQDSEKVLGGNMDLAEAMFLWLLKSRQKEWSWLV